MKPSLYYFRKRFASGHLESMDQTVSDACGLERHISSISFWQAVSAGGFKSGEDPLRMILHCDLDYFFAQCEELSNPGLSTKPLVICAYSGRTEDSGVVSTANYVARKLRVNSGLPIIQAKKILEGSNATYLPIDRPRYESISDRVMAIFSAHVGIVEKASIDEAYLDITEQVQLDLTEGRNLAQSLKRDIRREEGLSCSIGLGANKVVAKIASGFVKPDGLTIVPSYQSAEFLSPLPVDKLPGIGKKTQERLRGMHLETIGDLAKSNIQYITAAFGKKMGTYFHLASRGMDKDPVRPRLGPEQLSRIVTLKENSRDTDMISLELEDLAQDLHAKALKHGLQFRSVGIIAVLENLVAKTRTKTLDQPNSSIDIIRGSSTELLRTLLEETDLQIRRVGIQLSNLTPTTGQTFLAEFMERPPSTP